MAVLAWQITTTTASTPLIECPEFQVNTFTTSNQEFPAIACLTFGDCVVTWQSVGQDSANLGVFAHRYDDVLGTSLGSEFRVNTFVSDAQQTSGATIRSNGDFVVVWQSDGQDGSGFGIYARRLLL